MGNLNPQILPSKSNENTRVGACEKEFELILKRHFGMCVFSQQELVVPKHERPYSADFLVVEPITNLHVDLEIDEPFAFGTREPIHCVGMDDYRNKCFLEANWIVLRFAEEQIVSQPLRCSRVLANVLYKYTANETWRELFKDVEKITPIYQWTDRKSKKLSRQEYRRKYLPQ